jgi:hypothetical protein
MRGIPALLFLAVAAYTGHRLCRGLLPGLDGSRLPADRQPVAPWVIAYPMAFLCGTLVATWAVYITTSALRNTSAPMVWGNLIVMTALLLLLAFDRRRARRAIHATASAGVTNQMRTRRWLDITIALVGLAVGAALMFHTCRLEGDTLVLGRTAFGDLNIHLGTARSFSWGSNFPTGYVAYAGSDIRYHFMFYFLVGNLEFLGLPLDWAINLPSILSFSSVLMLLYGIGSVAGRDSRVGALAVLLFLLRSSPAAFYYFAQLPGSVPSRMAAIARTRQFIGITTHESWGIWNLNVYVVERHFAFALGLVMIAVLYLLRTTGLDSGPLLLRSFRERAGTPASVRE